MSRAKNPTRDRAQIRKQQYLAPPGRGSFLAGKNLNAALCLLLAAATFALYSPVLGHGFVMWDDQPYVTQNPHIADGLAWSTFKWAFTSTEASNWHPLTWLSHALDYQLFALNPMGHHLDSILIHSLNVALLFLLLAWVTKRIGPSLLVAALFAVHPLNVESVAWVAVRKNLLSTFFFFLTIAAYVWYVGKTSWRRYLLVVALFALGLMAKPMVITLPFVLLLLDYWPLERMSWEKTQSGLSDSKGSGLCLAARVRFSRLLIEKLPLLLLSAASAWITMKAQQAAVRPLEEFPFAFRIENAIVSYGLYLRRMVWPTRLAVFYPHPTRLFPLWQVALSAVILVGISALVVVFRRKGYLPVGWFWFLGTLVPVLGLVQVGEGAMADRYAYLSLIGIFVIIAWTLDDWAEAREVRTIWRVIPVLCVLAALALITLRQISYWDSEFNLWSHTVAITKESPFAHGRLAMALLNPEAGMTRSDLERFDTEQKRLDEVHTQHADALEIYRPLARQNPAAYLLDEAEVLQNLGNVDRFRNRPDEARQHYEDALASYRQLAQQNPSLYIRNLPYVATANNDLAFLVQLQNRPDDARQHFQDALSIYRQLAEQNPDKYLPDLAVASNNLGRLDGSQNRTDDARQHFQDALKIYRRLAQQNPQMYLPDLAVTLNNLGLADRFQKRMEESRVSYTEALTIYRRLAQGDPGRYTNDIARVQASLTELGQTSQ